MRPLQVGGSLDERRELLRQAAFEVARPIVLGICIPSASLPQIDDLLPRDQQTNRRLRESGV